MDSVSKLRDTATLTTRMRRRTKRTTTPPHLLSGKVKAVVDPDRDSYPGIGRAETSHFQHALIDWKDRVRLHALASMC